MPGTGYGEAAMRIGLRRGTRAWWFKIVLLVVFVAGIAAGALIMSFFK